MTRRALAAETERVAGWIREDWLKYRLAPKLFAHAGRLEEHQVDVATPFGHAQDFPTTYFEQPLMRGFWGELGRAFAVGEVRELADRLAASGEARPPAHSLVREVSAALDRLQAFPGEAAIIAPPPYRVIRELGVSGAPREVEDERSLASPWFRGMFEDAPVFALPLAPTRPLWVIDFGRIGEWRTRGAVDEMDIRVTPSLERLVRLGKASVPASTLTLQTFSDIVIADPTAAVGIVVPGDGPDAAAGSEASL